MSLIATASPRNAERVLRASVHVLQGPVGVSATILTHGCSEARGAIGSAISTC